VPCVHLYRAVPYRAVLTTFVLAKASITCPHRLGVDAFVKHFYVKSQPMTEADFEKLTKMTVLEVSLSLLFSLARHGALDITFDNHASTGCPQGAHRGQHDTRLFGWSGAFGSNENPRWFRGEREIDLFPPRHPVDTLAGPDRGV